MILKFSKATTAYLKAVKILMTIEDNNNVSSSLHQVPLREFNALKAWCFANGLEFSAGEEVSHSDNTRYYYVLQITGTYNIFSAYYSR